MLLKEPFSLRISRNIKVSLPSPGSFFLHKLLISTRSKRKDKQEKDLRQAIYIGKYIIMNTEERVKLLKQWQKFPNSWKNKVNRALGQSRQVLPLEAGFIKQIEKVLS
jgi:hypothetical protein